MDDWTHPVIKTEVKKNPVMEESTYWGYELFLDCAGADDRITDRDHVIAFAKELVKRIDMEAYGEPWCHYFAGHDATKAGFTLFQPISTSAITAHFVDAYGLIFLNVFSCKTFDKKDVVEVVREYFGPTKIGHSFAYRKAPDVLGIHDLQQDQW